MKLISSEEINAICKQANIVEIIGSYVPLTQKGRNFFGVCPFHDDNNPSMSVSPELQIYKCFSCGASGNVFTFVQNYENISFTEALKVVADKVGYNIDIKTEKKVNPYTKEYELMDLANKYFMNNIRTKDGNKAREYLLKRGINDSIINEFNLGLSLDNNDFLNYMRTKKYDLASVSKLGLINKYDGEYLDLFKNRIMIPIIDNDGNPVGFTGRIYNNESTQAKYVNSRETIIFKKGEILYNYFNALNDIKKSGYVILVEGNMDAIRLSSEGIKNVVALMGTAFTSNHISALKKLKVKVLLCLDNDEAGSLATYNISESLIKNNIDFEIIGLSGAKDPDEYIYKNSKEEFINLIKHPIKFVDYKYMYLKKNRNLSDPTELSKFINEILVTLDNIKDSIEKELTINKIAKEYNINIELLKSKLVQKEEMPKKVEQKKKIRKNKYIIAYEKLLYFMMNDAIFIKMYEKRLGYLPNQKYRDIVNEILVYYEEHKKINIADFISFIANKNEINNEVYNIVSQCSDTEISESEMYQYIDIINKEIINEKIEYYKKLLKNEIDENKKMKYATRIMNLKKGNDEDD